MRATRTWARRFVVAVAIAFGLSAAIPAGTVPDGGAFPVSWLWSWVPQSPAWSSSAMPGIPVQQRGKAPDEHHVPADATRARGGSGSPQQRVKDGLAPYAPGKPVQVSAADLGLTPPKLKKAKQEKGPQQLSAQTATTNAPPQVDARFPANNAAVRDLDPMLVVRAHDPDNNPGTGLEYEFAVLNADASEIVASSSWINEPRWRVPSGKLHWNETYLYTMRVHDNEDVSELSPAFVFTTAVPQRHVASQLAQSTAQGFDPATGNYSISAVDASIDTVGPPLSIVRTYNSLDFRTDENLYPQESLAFGRGWSSILDMRADWIAGADGRLKNVAITYPDGRNVVFGREDDGTFTPPKGRFATLTELPDKGGYELTDKDAVTYRFGQVQGGCCKYGITSITDANGRALTFEYETGERVGKMTSASGRALHFTWDNENVRTVSTDPVVPGDPDTALTWQYTYNYPGLLKVCPPTSLSECTEYEYRGIRRHVHAVEDEGPSSYWRLIEAEGAELAESSVLANAGVDNGVYHDVELGQPAGGWGVISPSATAGGFNGASSYVQLPGKVIHDGPEQTISLWFKTPQDSATGGVLISTQNTPVTETPINHDPLLYVGTDGKLYGQFYTGAVEPMTSSELVNDGQWHHAVLTASAKDQELLLDGRWVARLTKPPAVHDNELGYAYVGTGRWTHRPATSGVYGYFTGQISDVAHFSRAMSWDSVRRMSDAGKLMGSGMKRIIRPSNGVTAEIAYDPDTGKVRSVTDDNGGLWTLSHPSVAGSSGVYAASVLGGRPADYWRLGDPAGTVDAINEVKGDTISYESVTFGAEGPFPDATAATFDGSASQIIGTGPVLDTTKSYSMSAWVYLTDDSWYRGAVAIDGERTHATSLGYHGNENKWRFAIAIEDGDAPPTAHALSTKPAELNTWTLLTGTYDAPSKTLKIYVDGVEAGSTTIGDTPLRAVGPLVIGRHQWAGYHGDYWHGRISDVAVFRSALSAEQVAAQYRASQQAAPIAITKVADGVGTVPMPVSTVTVTDPGGEEVSFSYDLLNGDRLVAETDALGNTTKYGYDVGGFSSLVYDPLGVLTEQVKDVRGNTIQSITCQDQAAQKCSSDYFTYYPDATSETLTPDARNDVLLTARDGRSSSATDNTYRTSYAYDGKGNLTSQTDPLGRVTTISYTDGTSVPAVDGGYAPAGLPVQNVTPGGAVEKLEYFANGDLARTTDPLGKVTSYTYDGLGRVLTENEVTDAFPDGLVTSLAYDKLGRVVKQTEPGVTNRVTGAAHTAVTETGYNADGFVTSQTISDSTGGDAPRTMTTEYNAFGQLVTETAATGAITRFEYDGYGNLAKEIQPDGAVIRNTYDAESNLLTSMLVGYTGHPDNPSDPADLVLTSKSYDPAGRLASETDAMGWTNRYTYTDDGLDAKVVRTDGTDTFVVEETRYDAAGNVTREVSDNGATVVEYTYDAAGRQTTEALDPDGLRRTTSYTYSLDDQVVAEKGTDAGDVVSHQQYAYDVDGNLVSEVAYQKSGVLPVGRWLLDEESGSAVPDSAGNSELAADGVTWAQDPVWGDRRVARFDGITSAIVTVRPVVDTTQPFTFAAWVNLADKQGSGNYQFVTAMGGRAGSSFKLAYSASGDSWTVAMATRKPDGGTKWMPGLSSASGVPQAGRWTHLAVMVDPDTRKASLYVNGDLAKSVTSEYAFNNPATSMYLGDQYGSSKWAGSISDVQVYQQALSAAEIADLHTATAPAEGTAPDVTTTRVSRTVHVVDNDGLVLSSVDPLGNAADFAYDEAGRLAITTDPAVNAEVDGGAPVVARPMTTVGYNTFGEETETKDPNGKVITRAYAADGQLISVTQPSYTPPGSTEEITPVTTHAYNSLGQVTSATDPLGNVTTFTYDQLGRLVKQTAPNEGVTTFTYDLAGDPLSVTDPNGAVTAATYDYLGQKLTSTQVVRQTEVSYTTSYTYDSAGQLTKVVSPDGVQNSATYNTAGETVSVTDGAGLVVRYAYDGAGRLVRTTGPDGTYTTTKYDLLGRAVAERSYAADDSLLTEIFSAYDAADNLVAATDAHGQVTRITYDPTGVMTSLREPVSGTDEIVTTFGHDLAGNQTRFTDGRGHAFLATYNSLGLLESQIEPETAAHVSETDRTFTLVYDAAGRPITELQPGGVTIDNTYDLLGNLVRQAGAGAEVATAERVLGYDPAGRMTSLSGTGGDNTISYDDRNLITSIAGPSGDSSFAYTGDGAMASRNDAAGTTSYGYDGAGRLRTVANPDTGVDLSLSYNDAGQLGGVGYGGSNKRTFDYDDLHRPVSDELSTAGGEQIASISYGWDANSNLVSKVTTGFASAAANSYIYDQADRLVAWDNGSAITQYGYDKAGNRVRNGSRTFSYDARNRLLGDGGGVSYEYTARGSLHYRVEGTVSLETQADAFGRVTRQYASATGWSDYSYDGLGRALQSGFAYTGLDNDLAVDGQATYTRGPSGDVVGVAQGATNTLAWTDLHTDLVGQFAADDSSLTGSAAFDPLGGVLAASGMRGNLGYQSEWTDALTGRVNMHARWYNPDTGQFDSRDSANNSPMPSSINANRYQYGNASPLTAVDPSGHKPCVKKEYWDKCPKKKKKKKKKGSKGKKKPKKCYKKEYWDKCPKKKPGKAKPKPKPKPKKCYKKEYWDKCPKKKPGKAKPKPKKCYKKEIWDRSCDKPKNKKRFIAIPPKCHKKEVFDRSCDVAKPKPCYKKEVFDRSCDKPRFRWKSLTPNDAGDIIGSLLGVVPPGDEKMWPCPSGGCKLDHPDDFGRGLDDLLQTGSKEALAKLVEELMEKWLEKFGLPEHLAKEITGKTLEAVNKGLAKAGGVLVAPVIQLYKDSKNPDLNNRQRTARFLASAGITYGATSLGIQTGSGVTAACVRSVGRVLGPFCGAGGVIAGTVVTTAVAESGYTLMNNTLELDVPGSRWLFGDKW